ncbi:hypothetical protein [Chondromyces apiculatus]|uniref:Uncharacterized protein n=1 Tax=Chondromyces apiculatus DSM 436 TaxID=1192034 RepID=A0A017THJ8_9BACT|nr:hypothetical protein [Chondromyces apiculatus]EYF08387.1 Hypothetical protein CAP_3916 [Chondromyces apiculatus DSM 436]
MDLTNIAPVRRAELIAAGQRFGSDVVLAQGRKTLAALAVHGAKLADFGFGLDDAEELEDACDELVTSGGFRALRRTDKKKSALGYERALRDAGEVRLRARSVLGNARRHLARTAGAEPEQAVRLIDSVLERTSLAVRETAPMAIQLDELRAVFGDATIAPVVAERGGPKAVTDLLACATGLHGADKAVAGPLGTPEHTERLDLVDGIVLELVRSAREAADVASKALGEPALVTVFSLSDLYPTQVGEGSKGDGPKGNGQDTKPSTDNTTGTGPSKDGTCAAASAATSAAASGPAAPPPEARVNAAPAAPPAVS